MSHCMRNILGLAAGGLILITASAQPARAAPPGAPFRPGVPSAQVRPNPLPLTQPMVSPQYNGTRPIGWDWWRIYPWSPYNAWKNPYWYPPYNNPYAYNPYMMYSGGYNYNPYAMYAANPYMMYGSYGGYNSYPSAAPAANMGAYQPTGTKQTGRMIEVGVYDNRFEPRSITITAGATVRWTNYDTHQHTVTSDSGLWDSGQLSPGSSHSYTFSTPGTYTYHCSNHPRMAGTVTVE